MEINPHEEVLAAARAQRWTPEFVDRYRQRAQVERKAAQVKSRIKSVAWPTLVKVNSSLDLRIAAINVDRIGRLGLTG